MINQSISLLSFIRLPLILAEDVTRRVSDSIKATFNVPNPNPTGNERYVNNIPKTEEDLVKTFKHFESLSPNNKNPEYIEFLAQTAFCKDPSWEINEDESGVLAALKEYEGLLVSKKLNPPENRITFFKEVPSLRNFLATKKEHISTDYSGVEEHERHETAVAKIIDTIGPWTIVKIPQGSDKETLQAAYLLCSNKRHGSSWCVGYENGRSLAGNYLPNGDFYLFQKNNVSVYAVSTIKAENDLILWNRADSPLVSTKEFGHTEGEDDKPKPLSDKLQSLLPSLQKTVVALGGTASEFFKSLSHVPEEIKPVIIALKKNAEAQIFKRVPNELLENLPLDKQNFIFKVLHKTDGNALIKDFNEAFDRHSYDTSIVLTLYAILTYIATPNKGIIFTADQLYNFNWPPFMAYVEAHANSHDREMSKEIHQALLKVINSAEEEK